MKLSVIMSAYNNEDTIEEAIASVLAQSFKDFEFIIVNDGSTDNTGKVIEQFKNSDARIIEVTQDNKGLAISLNKAINQAQGEYIARQDADDISLPDRFINQVAFLESNMQFGFVGCSCEIVNKDRDLLKRVSIINDYKRNISLLKKRNIFCHGSIMFRAEIIKKAGGYRDLFRLSQDYDLYLRLIEFTLPGSVDKILYQRRESWENISAQKAYLQAVYADLAKRCYRARLTLKDDSNLLNEFQFGDNNKQNLSNYYADFMKALYCLRHGKIKQARSILFPYLRPRERLRPKLYALWLITYLPASFRDFVFFLRRITRLSSKNEI